MGWNYFEMRGKFCIRSAEPDGAAPLLRGLHSSAIPREPSWRWWVRHRPAAGRVCGLRRTQLLHHGLQSGAGLLPGCGPAGARAAGFSADAPGALPLQLRHRIGGRYPEPDHHPAGKGSRGGETIRDRSGAAGHRPGGRERRNPYSRPSSSIRRTSCRLAHSAVYRRRISSSGWARSGTITVTKPPAAPARTPL